MKILRHKYHQTFLYNTYLFKEPNIETYHLLLSEILHCKNISAKKYFALINMNNNKITSAPYKVKNILLNKNLQPFKFLVCLN